MEFESSEKQAMVYETLKNIETAITRLQERTVQIHTVDDFLLSPFGMEKESVGKLLSASSGICSKSISESACTRKL